MNARIVSLFDPVAYRDGLLARRARLGIRVQELTRQLLRRNQDLTDVEEEIEYMGKQIEEGRQVA